MNPPTSRWWGGGTSSTSISGKSHSTPLISLHTQAGLKSEREASNSPQCSNGGLLVHPWETTPNTTWARAGGCGCQEVRADQRSCGHLGAVPTAPPPGPRGSCRRPARSREGGWVLSPKWGDVTKGNSSTSQQTQGYVPLPFSYPLTPTNNDYWISNERLHSPVSLTLSELATVSPLY